MKRIFLDTNVIIDFILEREGAEDAANVLQLGENGEVELTVQQLPTVPMMQLSAIFTSTALMRSALVIYSMH